MTSESKTDRKSDEKSGKFMFQDGETVLCYHGPLLYEAKCVKGEFKNKEKSPQYLIHYSGWNKSWDEWVNSPRVCKFSEENLKKQQELLKSHGTSKIITKIKANARKSISSISNSAEDKLNLSESKKKRPKAHDESSELSDSYTIKNEIKISITDLSKKFIANDYNSVSGLNKLVILPSSNPIDNILNDYVEFKVAHKFDKDVILEVAQGIKYYFNSTLSSKLLINPMERQQFLELQKNRDKKPSEIYGIEHLLRLFVIIGDLLSYTIWDEICIKQLDLYIEEFIKYLEDKSDAFYNLDNHYAPPANYLQKPAVTEKK